VTVRGGHAWRWVTGPLFRSYLGSFSILWVLTKSTLAAHDRVTGLDPFVFQPQSETWACVLELLVLTHFIRRRGEDVLLGNLGLGLGSALLPFALAHAALSGALALLAP